MDGSVSVVTHKFTDTMMRFVKVGVALCELQLLMHVLYTAVFPQALHSRRQTTAIGRWVWLYEGL